VFIKINEAIKNLLILTPVVYIKTNLLKIKQSCVAAMSATKMVDKCHTS